MRKEEMIAVLKDIQQNGVSLKNYSSIKKMIADLEDEVRHDNNKKSGTVSIEKAAKSIIKSGKEKPQTALHGAFVAKNGRQYVCDGCRAMEIINPIELEKIPDHVMPLDVPKLFEKTDFPECFPLPTAAELKSMIAGAKADAKLACKKNPLIVYGIENGPAINAQYLLDAIQGTGAEYLTTEKNPRSKKYLNPCILKSDECTVLLLPMNIDTKLHEKNKCFAI